MSSGFQHTSLVDGMVKKKWENLVSKTKRKVRAGHITPELDWNETNAAVMQFLTQHSPPVRLRYLSSTGPSLLTSSVLTTSGGATAMNGAFNQTNSHIYGLSNTSFSDPYSNNNNDSSIFSNRAGGSGDKQHLNTSTEDKDVDMTTGNNNNNSNTNNINNSSQNHGE
ncbi:unnamed protein product [Trichobilharzia regenti]|nr:unnamed protein product [Trichobilharzia regenti]